MTMTQESGTAPKRFLHSPNSVSYTGIVHDRADRLANDAWVALKRLVHSGRAVVGTDPEERGAVPTIRHSARPDQYAQVGIDLTETREKGGRTATMIIVTVVPSPSDQLRTSAKITVNDPGELVPEGCTYQIMADRVLEAAAVHLARAVEQHRRDHPGCERSDDFVGPDVRYLLDGDETAKRRAVDAASIAVLNQNVEPHTVVTIPTPWTPLTGFDMDGVAVGTDPDLAARVPILLGVKTGYVFSDKEGRGTSLTATLHPVSAGTNAAGAMDRLRAMKAAADA